MKQYWDNLTQLQMTFQGVDKKTGIWRNGTLVDIDGDKYKLRWTDERGEPGEFWTRMIRRPVPENNLSSNEMQDSDRVMYEHSTDGVPTANEQSYDDNRDATVIDNAHYVFKDNLDDLFELGSMTGSTHSRDGVHAANEQSYDDNRDATVIDNAHSVFKDNLDDLFELGSMNGSTHSRDGVHAANEQSYDDNRDATVIDNAHYVFKDNLDDLFELGSMNGSTHSRDGVHAANEESTDDKRDETVMNNALCVFKEYLDYPFEVGSMTCSAQRQPRPVVCTSMTSPTIEPVTSWAQEATLPASNLFPVEESQQILVLNDQLSKVFMKLESMDERLGILEKRMKLAEASPQVDYNNNNSRNKNSAVNRKKDTTKISWNFSVDFNDFHDGTNIREDSVSSKCGVENGASSNFTPINQIVQDENKELMRINHNGNTEFTKFDFNQASVLPSANEQGHHIEASHGIKPFLSPSRRPRQICMSFIRKALSRYYTLRELAICHLTGTKEKNVKHLSLSPKRMKLLLGEAKLKYPDEYRRLHITDIVEIVQSECRNITYHSNIYAPNRK